MLFSSFLSFNPTEIFFLINFCFLNLSMVSFTNLLYGSFESCYILSQLSLFIIIMFIYHKYFCLSLLSLVFHLGCYYGIISSVYYTPFLSAFIITMSSHPRNSCKAVLPPSVKLLNGCSFWFSIFLSNSSWVASVC